MAESAWSSLKRELVSRYRFATRAEAREAIFAWINRYNSRRRHSTLGYIAPITWEQQYHQPKAGRATAVTGQWGESQVVADPIIDVRRRIASTDGKRATEFQPRPSIARLNLATQRIAHRTVSGQARKPTT